MTKILEDKTGFSQRYAAIACSVDSGLEDYLGRGGRMPDVLREAMLYSVRAGGKRLRPVMVVLACEACGGSEADALPAAVAMELVHTYSLIHDDLPAMDDDDLRRGQPTNHKVFGEGIAILAGDGLLTYAFGILAAQSKSGTLAQQLAGELSEAAGPSGMIGGQVADLTGENKQGDRETVDYIHTHKTAMMFRAAMRMGAYCAGAKRDMVDMLGDFGLKLGLAFQIVDDLLDITGCSEQLGKEAQKDDQAGKLTYPGVVGIVESQRYAQELVEQGKVVLGPLGQAGRPLGHLADMLVEREN